MTMRRSAVSLYLLRTATIILLASVLETSAFQIGSSTHVSVTKRSGPILLNHLNDGNPLESSSPEYSHHQSDSGTNDENIEASSSGVDNNNKANRFSKFAPDTNLSAAEFREQLKENMKADLERRRREDPNRGNQPAKSYLDSL